MERGPRDDLKWGAAVLLGAVLGWLIFASDTPGVLVGSLIGIVIAIAVVNIARGVRSRRPGAEKRPRRDREPPR